MKKKLNLKKNKKKLKCIFCTVSASVVEKWSQDLKKPFRNANVDVMEPCSIKKSFYEGDFFLLGLVIKKVSWEKNVLDWTMGTAAL